MMKRMFKVLFVASLVAALRGEAKIYDWENEAFSAFPADLQSAINAGAQPDWEKGFLDVTKAPFNAAGNGSADDTAELNKAIDYGYAYNFVVYFPAGHTFKISGTLTCLEESTGGARKYCHKLLGGSTGARPVIKVADGASLTENIAIKYWRLKNGVEREFDMFGAEFRNIDIDMGNNPTGIALYMNGAQHCVIEDVKIYGTAFNVGIKNLPGSGGYTANTEVDGGDIGVLQDNYRPTPSLIGCTFSNQAQYGIRVLESRGPVTLSGCKIISPPTPDSSYRAISLQHNNGDWNDYFHASLCLIDSSIDVAGSGGRAIYNYASSVYMENAYIRAATLIESGVKQSPTESLAGDASAWKRIDWYAFSHQYTGARINVDGTDYGPDATGADTAVHGALSNATPPSDLASRHLWGSFPSWEDSGAISITDYGAVRDDDTVDNTAAIQNAINSAVGQGKTLFIPRGVFYIRSPLTMKAGLKMVGAANNNSVIMLSKDHWVGTETGPQLYALDSDNNANGSLAIGKFAFVGHEVKEGDPTGDGFDQIDTLRFKNTTLFRLRLGNSVVRDMQLDKRSYWRRNQEFDAPAVVIEDGAGGKLYSVIMDIGPNIGEPDIATYTSAYRSYLIRNTTRPLTIYHLDSEYFENVEPQAEINNCDHVRLIAMKWEEHGTYLKIKDSDDISVLGCSGNYNLIEAASDAIVTIENSTNFELAMLSRLRNVDASGGYDPTYKVINDHGNSWSSPQSAELTLCRRGSPSGVGGVGAPPVISSINFGTGGVSYSWTSGTGTFTNNADNIHVDAWHNNSQGGFTASNLGFDLSGSDTAGKIAVYLKTLSGNTQNTYQLILRDAAAVQDSWILDTSALAVGAWTLLEVNTALGSPEDGVLSVDMANIDRIVLQGKWQTSGAQSAFEVDYMNVPVAPVGTVVVVQ